LRLRGRPGRVRIGSQVTGCLLIIRIPSRKWWGARSCAPVCIVFVLRKMGHVPCVSCFVPSLFTLSLHVGHLVMLLFLSLFFFSSPGR
jgi:hypothetical protein